MSDAYPEPAEDFRVPSQYPRCRRQLCRQLPVADMRRTRYHKGATDSVWWAYCAEHLREYNREVRGDTVWFLGTREDGEP